MANGLVCLNIYIFTVSMFLFTESGAQCTLLSRPRRLSANSFPQFITPPTDIYGLYYLDSNCAWRIKSSPPHVVRLDVVYVNLQPSVGCHLDSVSVYDGYSNTDSLMKTFCSDESEVFYSTGSYMYVTFASDGGGQIGTGFRLSYTEVLATESQSTQNPTPTETGSHVNLTVLFLGLVGGITFLIVLAGLRRYFRRNRESTRSFTSSSSTDPNPTSSAFTTSGGNVSSVSGAHTNVAFSEYSEPPPSYNSLQHSGSPAVSSCLPSYSEFLSMSNNPDSPKPEETNHDATMSDNPDSPEPEETNHDATMSDNPDSPEPEETNHDAQEP